MAEQNKLVDIVNNTVCISTIALGVKAMDHGLTYAVVNAGLHSEKNPWIGSLIDSLGPEWGMLGAYATSACVQLALVFPLNKRYGKIGNVKYGNVIAMALPGLFNAAAVALNLYQTTSGNNLL